MKEYIKKLLQKYDYYDPVKDRMEVLRFARLKNSKILDVGTGFGHIAILAAKEYNCLVTAIDNCEEKIMQAKENARKENVLDKITFTIADATQMPYPNNSFDVVMSFNALHHCRGDYKKIVSEMFRVSKKKVVITELNETGAKAFDEFIHPEENHRKMILNLELLHGLLKEKSKVSVLERKTMNTYVCEKMEEQK
ncbi:MAG: class I SAM-dependent methyltransferase [archaeon]